MDSILDSLINSEKNNTFKPAPFWSWNNYICKDQVIKQIREMKSVGFGGFVIHARCGLKTEYLSDEWFELIEVCIKEAENSDMNIWIYDEFGFPSGFVGGKLLDKETNRALYLEYEIKKYFDDDAYAVYIDKDGKTLRVNGPSEGAKEYKTIYRKVSPSEVDILCPHVVDLFIEDTHEQYYKRFSRYFGNVIRGFFTDEPQYYRYGTPTSWCMEEEYFKKYGEELKDGLFHLFGSEPDDYRFRVRYYKLMNERYTEVYYKKLYDWCEGHGCLLTGHTCEEPHLYSQMWCCAGAMPTYEYCQIPGIDHLCRFMDGCIDEIQVESVARQLKKKYVMSESFGCSGYDANFRILKYIADFQMIYGINYFIYHLTNYSLQGQGYKDFPPTFSSHAAWFDDLKYFNNYITAMCALTANSEEHTDVLVLHPMQSTYLTYDRAADDKSVFELDRKFTLLTERLVAEQVAFHFGDDVLIEKYGLIKGNKFVIGNCSYKYVVVPEMDDIAKSTYAILKEFADAGGKVCLVGKFPAYIEGVAGERPIKGNITLKEIGDRHKDKIRFSGNGRIRTRYFSNDSGDFVFILNDDEKNDICLETADRFFKTDVELKTLTEIKGNLILKPHCSVLLKKIKAKSDKRLKEFTEQNFSVAEYADKECCEKKDETDSFRFTRATDNSLILDMVRVSTDGEKYSAPMYCPAVTDKYLYENYAGDLYLKYTFNISEKIAPLKFMAQNDRVKEIFLNGKPLTVVRSDFDPMFYEADITDMAEAGENSLVFHIDHYQSPQCRYAFFGENVTESLRNMVTFETNIEPVYIMGQFLLTDDLKITAMRDIGSINNFQEHGMPFFSGEAVLEGNVYANRPCIKLELIGNFMSADIYVNGEESNHVVTDTEVVLNKGVRVGENKIEIVLKSSMRNMFGPHHFLGMTEMTGVAPGLFTMRCSWNEGKSRFFNPEYQLVNFGIEKILISK